MKIITVSLGFLEFPPDHTGDGANLSPRIALGSLDPGTASVAVMVYNPFMKTCCSFTPWIIWNIPPVQVIPPGGRVETPVSAVQGTNDYGVIGYTGPQPPAGEMHRYQVKVYCLDAMLDLAPGSAQHELVAAMRDHVLRFGETVAICTR